MPAPGHAGDHAHALSDRVHLFAERVTIITETDSQVRRVYTDGRKLPEDPDPAFNGSSIGHWEGNVLIVDTIGLNPENSLSEGIHPTENTRIRERFEMTKRMC